MKPRSRLLFGIMGVALLALMGPGLALASHAQATQANTDQGVPRFDHVFIIMMENHTYSHIIGDTANEPFINQLATEYGLATNYYGVTHPSLPNYVAATSGNNWYSNSDNPSQTFNHENIVDQLETHHLSWKAYMESMPSVGFTGAQSPDGLYVKKHDPFMLYDDITSNPSRTQNVVPLTQLTTDLNSNHVANYVWITPNVCDDMHGMGGSTSPCPYGNTPGDANDTRLKQDGNAFVQTWVTAIMNSKAWTHNSAIFLTWDEDDYTGNTTDGGWDNPQGCCDSPVLGLNDPNLPAGGLYGGGPVPMIVVSPMLTSHGFTSDAAFNHYSMLKTIEESWGLKELGMTADDANVQPMSAFFAHP